MKTVTLRLTDELADQIQARGPSFSRCVEINMRAALRMPEPPPLRSPGRPRTSPVKTVLTRAQLDALDWFAACEGCEPARLFTGAVLKGRTLIGVGSEQVEALLVGMGERWGARPKEERTALTVRAWDAARRCAELEGADLEDMLIWWGAKRENRTLIGMSLSDFQYELDRIRTKHGLDPLYGP